MRVGGAAEWLLEPKSPHELHAAYVAALERGVVPRLLGGGANVIVADGLLSGVVIATDCLRRVFRSSRAPAEAMEAELSAAAHFDPEAEPILVAWSGASLPAGQKASVFITKNGSECSIGKAALTPPPVPSNSASRLTLSSPPKWASNWSARMGLDT